MPADFVHGITVREDRFKSLLLTVDEALWKRVPALGVKGFYWGNMASSLRYAGASIPGFLEGTGPSRRSAHDERHGQLTMPLLDDPPLELRLPKDTDDTTRPVPARPSGGERCAIRTRGGAQAHRPRRAMSRSPPPPARA
jgi:hypothetical protein